jgi:hypothetical protein
MSYYTPYKVKGFAAWFDGLAHASDELTKIGQMKQDAMKVAGTWPADELLASLDEKERLKTVGNARAICDEFAEETYFAPVGRWLRDHRAAFHHVDSEEHGNRVCFDFKREADRDRFLAAHPKWTTEKPETWYDNPGVAPREKR